MRNSGLNGNSNPDLCNTSAVLYPQLSYQANWELDIMWVAEVRVQISAQVWIFQAFLAAASVVIMMITTLAFLSFISKNSLAENCTHFTQVIKQFYVHVCPSLRTPPWITFIKWHWFFTGVLMISAHGTRWCMQVQTTNLNQSSKGSSLLNIMTQENLISKKWSKIW